METEILGIPAINACVLCICVYADFTSPEGLPIQREEEGKDETHRSEEPE